MKPQQIRLNHMHNQMLVNLDTRLEDIERIANTLPLDTDDEKVLAMSMFFLASLLRRRRGEALLTEASA